MYHMVTEFGDICFSLVKHKCNALLRDEWMVHHVVVSLEFPLQIAVCNIRVDQK
jgi:hypothetical protein